VGKDHRVCETRSSPGKLELARVEELL
jgi:hypothetical protein